MAKKTPEQISYNMKRVKNKGSEIEVLLQKELWRRGLRYRKNVKSIEGKPDIAFIGKKLLYFAIVNFGMAMIGKTEKTTLNLMRISGSRK